MKKLLIVMLTLSIFFIGCKKNDSPKPISPTDIVIAKEVKVISNQIWSENIISLDSIDYTITFKKGITLSTQIKVGDIIVSAVGEGLLRKVSSIVTVNNEIKVETEFASISDCIQQGIININQPLTIKQIKRISYNLDGIKLKSGVLKGNDNEPINLDINAVIYDSDGNLSTTADQVKLIGSLTCDWGFNLLINVSILDGLKEVKFGVSGSENLDLQLVDGIQYNFNKEISLATIEFTPIVVFVGVVPIVVSPQLNITIGIDGSANASITSDINQSLSFDNGIRYLSGTGWSPYSTFSKSFSFQPPQLNINASTTAYLKPEFFINVDLVAGPYANLKIYSRLDADLLQTPWWKLYGGISMAAGAKVKIINLYTLDYTVSDLINIELLLAQATTPPVKLPTVTTTTITGITQTSASGGGNVTSDGNATVTVRGVCWSTSQTPTTTNSKTTDGTGPGIFSSSLTSLVANTTYYIRAYATNSAGTNYGAQVSFTTQNAGGLAPVADFTTSSSSVSIGQSIQFIDNSTNSPTSWLWNFGDGATSTEKSPIHSYGSNGTFTVSLTVTNSYGSNTKTQPSYITVTQSSNSGIIFNPNLTYGTMSDNDGNTYKTIQIGTQTWMAENLKTTLLNDGTSISLVTAFSDWYNRNSPAYCWPNNDNSNKDTYGALYNWYTVNTKLLCPTEWHVPTDSEWTTLTDYLSGESIAGSKLKETGISHWQSPNDATNESGFTAIPSGYRSGDSFDKFAPTGYGSFWWASESTQRNIININNMVNKNNSFKTDGFSVRCIKN